MVGLNRRFYSVFNKGVNFLKKNGGIKGILIEGHERFWKIYKNRNKHVYHNWIYANSIHTIDLIRFFGGEVKKFKSFSGNEKKFRNFSISIQFKSGAIGSYISNWHSPGGWKVKLFGKLFTVIFKPLEQGIIVDRNFKIKKIIADHKDKKFKPGFYGQMMNFKNLILKKKLKYPAQSLTDLLKTVKIINRI